MDFQSNWDAQHRKEAWNLIIDASKILGIPLSPTISTAINYIHLYYEISGQLNSSLFEIALLATFVACKAQETIYKADDLIDAFGTVGLQRSSDQLSILDFDFEQLNEIKSQGTESFENFRKKFLDSELDFMTALKWNFPEHVPFYTLKKWIDDLKSSIKNEEFDSISNQLQSLSNGALCNLILFPDSLYTNIEDLAASAIAYGWNKLGIDIDWSAIIKYDTENEVFTTLLNRLEEIDEQDLSGIDAD